MITELFWVESKPQSINNMYYGKMMTKTQEAREWSYAIFHQLSTQDNALKFKALREAFNASEHGFQVNLTHYFPEKIFYTKAGEISARTHDVTNVEKPLVDLLFLPKYFAKTPPYGMENLNIDDKHLLNCNSWKLPTTEDAHKIKIEISIIEHPVLPVDQPEELV